MEHATVLDLDVLRSGADQACRLMKVLSNPDRLLLLCQLAQGEKRVGELEELVGISQPTLGRHIQAIEAALEVPLFTRTAQGQTLTEAGQVYFEQCRQAIAQLVEAEREIGGRQREPSGTLRLSVPTSFGHNSDLQ